ncbi:alpha/beta hydrolase [Nocardia stercoris]|uniref:alpha/beta hydrolase n=1 Tax=Nocardia stercoris TaxID=2483361 RepID=UPI001F2ED5FB|nr:alpha/beta hydrolase family protein [Nocardia stercoris]
MGTVLIRWAAAAVISILAAGGIATAQEPHVPAGGYSELSVPSSMGPVKVQVQWAKHGGTAALYVLDGMHATNDVNEWTRQTDIMAQFADDDITLVFPVGGEASFYTDWLRPSAFNLQRVTYRWETFLTTELPDYLARYGVSATRDGVIGPSMGGSAALTLAALHPGQFAFAGSLSGFPDLSGPGMPEAVCTSMLAVGGYEVDAMWGPPLGPVWRQHDPSELAEQLRGTSLFVSAGSGVPGPEDKWDSAIGVAGSLTGFGLELIARGDSLRFQQRMQSLGIDATWDFPATGVHEWGNWQTRIAEARPQILGALTGG